MSDTTPQIHDRPELADADEAALAGLLTRAHRPPRIRAKARVAILDKLKSEQKKMVNVRTLAPARRRRLGAWGAFIAAAALLVLWLRAASQPVMHHNESDAPRVVSFADGTQVVLDAGARMVERGAREIEMLEGRALFDVAQGSPYVLTSAHGSVVGEGTRFIVSTDGATTRAAVARGRIKAITDAGEAQLAAGDQTALSSGKAPVREAARRLTYLASWARDTLAAEEPPEVQPIRRGNLEARIPDSETSWPLPMRKLAVDVFVEDGVVRTTFDHTFFNHHNRNLEGVYTFSLPADAAVSRLAMYVDGTLMEGGIVERQRGRNIYEDIVYRRRDPALLEWMSGNELKVRIFPLPARTEKRILMSYTQVLSRLYDTQRLVVPIPEIDQPVGQVQFRVRVADGARYHLSSTSHALNVSSDGTDRVATFEASDHAIGKDLVVSLKEEEPERKSVRTFEDGEHRYLLARVQPELPQTSSARAPQDWVVLFDTSASRTPGAMKAQERMLEQLSTELDTHDRFAVVAFDATQRVMPGGFHRVGDFDPGELAAFLANEARDSIGYTDLGGGLAKARELFEGRSGALSAGNILYIGDGVPTAGKRELAELRGLLEGYTFVGVGVGDRADSAALSDLAEASGGAFAKVTASEDLSWRAFDLVAELNTPRLTAITARVVDAAGHTLPAEVHADVQATGGEDVSVIARLPKDSDAVAVVLEAGAWSERVALEGARGDAKHLSRLWARTHIDALVREDRKTHEKVITDLGLANFLVTPFTSLLVLETEADYEKHKVVRPAADRWARYEAPAKIDVVREPLGKPAIPFGSVVLRQRPMAAPNWGYRDRTIVTETFALPRVRMGAAGKGRFFAPALVDLPMDGKLADFDGRFAFNQPMRGPRLPPRDRWNAWARPEEDRTRTQTRASGTTMKQPVSGASVPEVFYTIDASGYLVDSLVGDELLEGGEASGFWQFSRTSLRDLTALVPELFADGIDVERQSAQRAISEGKQGAISAEARALLDGAKREPARYRFPGGGEVTIHSGAGTRFSVTRESSMGLGAELFFDGETVTGVYPELELITERDATGATMAALSRFAPFVTPAASELESHYDVRVVGTRKLRIAHIGGGPAVSLTLDADGRVVRYERGGIAITVKWAPDAVTLTMEDAPPVKIARAAESPSPTTPRPWTTVKLPLRDMAFAKKAVEDAEEGSAAWRAAMRQLLATQAANGHASWGHIDQLVAAGLSPMRGELVLASSGVHAGASDTLKKLGSDPVARYLRDVIRYRDGAGADAFEPRDGAGRFLTNLRAYQRVVTTYVSSFDDWKPLYAALSDADPRLRLAALSHIANYTLDSGTDDVVSALDTLAAEPSVRREAQLRAAERLRWRNRRDEAAVRFQNIIDAEDANHVYLDASRLQQTMAHAPNGVAAFRRWMLARRDRLVAAGTPASLVAAAVMLDAWGTPDDLEVVMNVVRRTEIRDASAAYQLATILNRRGFIADADRLARAHIDSGPQAKTMLMLAADIAENDNRHGDAAELVTKAMDKEEAMPLTELRQLYRRRFQLHVSHARALSLPHIEDALEVAAMWRREDPDNAEIDKLCFGALSARGDHLGAFRHLSSIIERHPGEGKAYADVAQSLVGQGRLVEAELIIVRATEVEPTNPTWHLRHADILEALSKPDAARAVLERVAKGEWQDRFSREVMTAKRRLGQ